MRTSSVPFPLWRRILPLLCALLVCTALWAEAQQSQLAQQIIRLHVVANSDRDADQALKLRVRDAVLAETDALLAGQTSAQTAASQLGRSLSSLEETAAETVSQAGYAYPVQVSLEERWFPTRQYAGGALPAGTYQTLRVVIGAGQGQNWWCVLFPALAVPAASETAVQTIGLDGQVHTLVTEETPAYTFRFKTLEWWGLCKGWLTGQT